MNENIKLQVKKVIKAKPQDVFAAWTRPEQMKRWFAPGAMTVPNASSDLKVGGQFAVEMLGTMDGEPINPTATGVYQKIIPNKLLVYTFAWKDEPDMDTLITVEFKPVDGGTEVTLTHERFANTKTRDNHRDGWIGCLENLAKYLDR